jgi:hypothetical protein
MLTYNEPTMLVNHFVTWGYKNKAFGTKMSEFMKANMD